MVYSVFVTGADGILKYFYLVSFLFIENLVYLEKMLTADLYSALFML